MFISSVVIYNINSSQCHVLMCVWLVCPLFYASMLEKGLLTANCIVHSRLSKLKLIGSSLSWPLLPPVMFWTAAFLLLEVIFFPGNFFSYHAQARYFLPPCWSGFTLVTWDVKLNNIPSSCVYRCLKTVGGVCVIMFSRVVSEETFGIACGSMHAL